jgi:alkaline phosphatase D
VQRRNFIRWLIGGLASAWAGVLPRPGFGAGPYTFRHGVASGDPLTDAVVIWTRVSGASNERISVDWEIAADAGMKSVLKAGRVGTGADRDYTVKVDVRDLPAGKTLYYRFAAGGAHSPTGRTRTLPAGAIDTARFAVVCCSNYAAGYYHAYREIARRDDLDAVIHLGDYIYEHGQGGYATEHAEELGRAPDPVHEVVTLDDYRHRYAQYKSDPDSQAMLAAHPLIAIWDDHEIANDAWHDGAENHNEGEGPWPVRRDAAIKAYFEWLPIRGKADGANTRIFREFRYGDLLSLIMLDTRLYGRDRQPKLDPDMAHDVAQRILDDPDRHMLGEQQGAWLDGALARAQDTTWQVIGQQVLVAPVRSPDLEPVLDLDRPAGVSREVLDANIAMSKTGMPLLLDSWDGYPVARERLLAEVAATCTNPVFLSGDLHTALAAELVQQGGKEVVAVEFMAPSVTSPGFGQTLPQRRPGALSQATLALNPNLAYMETEHRGWLCMTFTASHCTGEWWLLDGIRTHDYASSLDRRLSVAAGRRADGLVEG